MSRKQLDFLNPSPVQKAKAVFETYADMDAPFLPEDHWSALQVRVARWQVQKFDLQSLERNALGVCEEAGELCHAILKNSQGIRGLDDEDRFREKAADAIADCAIFLMQCATCLRLDFAELVEVTATDIVLKR